MFHSGFRNLLDAEHVLVDDKRMAHVRKMSVCYRSRKLPHVQSASFLVK